MLSKHFTGLVSGQTYSVGLSEGLLSKVKSITALEEASGI